MTKEKLQDRRVELRSELENIIKAKQIRSLNDDEHLKMKTLLNEVRSLDDKIDVEIKQEELILREENKKAVVVETLTENKIENRDMTKNLITRALEADGGSVPLFIKNEDVKASNNEFKTDAVKELVPETLVQIMGADVSYLTGNVEIPIYGKVQEKDIDFVEEGYEVGEMALGITTKQLTPKRIGVKVSIPAITEEMDVIGTSKYIQERAFSLLGGKIDKKVLSEIGATNAYSAGVFNGVEKVDNKAALLNRTKLLKVSGEMMDKGSDINTLSVIGSGSIETSFLTQKITETGMFLLDDNTNKLQARGMEFKRSSYIASNNTALIGDMSMIAINYFLNNIKVVRQLKPSTDMVEYYFTFYVDWCNKQPEAFRAITNVKID